MIVIVIPAKGGSSRLPNKNMALVNGRPMLEYTVDVARASAKAHKIYVSTDDDAIAAHAQSLGVALIRRPSSLGGEVPIIDVYRHALEQMPDSERVETLVGMQPDHPDRTVAVDDALAKMVEEKADRLVSIDPDGTKNGAYNIFTRQALLTDGGTNIVSMVDECTNIHFEADLKRAETRLLARNGTLRAQP